MARKWQGTLDVRFPVANDGPCLVQGRERGPFAPMGDFQERSLLFDGHSHVRAVTRPGARFTSVVDDSVGNKRIVP